MNLHHIKSVYNLLKYNSFLNATIIEFHDSFPLLLSSTPCLSPRWIYKNPMTTNPDKIHTARPKAFFLLYYSFLILLSKTFILVHQKETVQKRTRVRHQTCLFKLVIYMQPICQNVLYVGVTVVVLFFVRTSTLERSGGGRGWGSIVLLNTRRE